MSDYRNELLECYSEPPEPHTKDEWVEMLLHGDQSDSDIMKLVAERDLLAKKLEQAKEALKFIGELLESNMGYWKIRAKEALQHLEAE